MRTIPLPLGLFNEKQDYAKSYLEKQMSELDSDTKKTEKSNKEELLKDQVSKLEENEKLFTQQVI